MKNEGIFLSILSPFFPPSICPSSPLRRKCYFGASFWTTRCCCPLARSLSVKSPGGSAWSSQTRPTGFAWVSSLPSQPLPCCPLPSGPTCGLSHLSLFIPTHPAINADRALTSLSQGCRGSGRCSRANPRRQKTPLPIRPRSPEASTGEPVVTSWPLGLAVTADLGLQNCRD